MLCKNSYKIAVGIFRGYFSPIVFVAGFVGNIFVILTFTSKPLRNRFAIYSVFLAMANIVILTVGTFVDDFTGRGLAFAIYGRCDIYVLKLDTVSDLSCKLIQYLPETMYFISSWMFVTFSLDRLLTIYKPIQFYSSHHSRMSLFVCILVVGVGFFMNIPIILSSGLTIKKASNITYKKCDVLTESSYLASRIALYMKVVFSFIVPIFIVLIINCVIIAKLWEIKIKRTRLMSKNSRQSGLEMNRIIGYLILSSCFLLLVFPLIIIMILRLWWSDRKLMSSQERKQVQVLGDLSRLFASVKDINYAADFYIYVLFLNNFKWHFLNRFLGIMSCLNLSIIRHWKANVLNRVSGENSRPKTSNSSLKVTKTMETKI